MKKKKWMCLIVSQDLLSHCILVNRFHKPAVEYMLVAR